VFFSFFFFFFYFSFTFTFTLTHTRCLANARALFYFFLGPSTLVVASQSQTLSISELKAFCTGLNDVTPNTAALRFMEEWDEDGNGEIDVDEWSAVWSRLRLEDGCDAVMFALKFFVSVASEAENLRAVELFNRIDLDDSGALDIQELRNFSAGLVALPEIASESDAAAGKIAGFAQYFAEEWADGDDASVTIDDWMAMWKRVRIREGAKRTVASLVFFDVIASRSEEVRFMKLFHTLNKRGSSDAISVAELRDVVAETDNDLGVLFQGE
jgi:Ca2+-binding EF-hand superfamily protein